MKAILPHFLQLIDHHLSLVNLMILSKKMKSSKPIFFFSICPLLGSILSLA